jgi:hypothetical protein
VVTVVIDQNLAGAFKHDINAAFSAGKFRQRWGAVRCAAAQSVHDRKRGRGVGNIVFSRQPKGKIPQR